MSTDDIIDALKGVPGVAAAAAANLGSMPAAGLRGIGKLVSGDGLDSAADAIRETQNNAVGLTAQLQDKYSAKLAGQMGSGMEAASNAAHIPQLEQKSLDTLGPEATTGLNVAAQTISPEKWLAGAKMAGMGILAPVKRTAMIAKEAKEAAEALEAAGSVPDVIWHNTGAIKDPVNGGYRVEIPDQNAMLNPRFIYKAGDVVDQTNIALGKKPVQGKQHLTLGDVVDHPDFAAMDPEAWETIRNTPIMGPKVLDAAAKKEGIDTSLVRAAYAPPQGGFDKGVFLIGRESDQEKILGSILHEIQHAYDRIGEGVSGTNTTIAGSNERYLNNVGELTASAATARKNLTNVERRLLPFDQHMRKPFDDALGWETTATPNGPNAPSGGDIANTLPAAPSTAMATGPGKTMTLYHYANSPDLTALDPAKYGTGIKGAENYRVLNAGNADFELPRTPKRTYMYDNPDSKEAGLGPHQYTATVPNMYDAEKDPLGLYDKAFDKFTVPETAQMNPGAINSDGALNWFEDQVKKKGFSGVHYPETGAAIVFNKTPVKRVPGVEMSLDTDYASATARDLAQRLQDNGGFTFSPSTGEHPAEGYVVSKDKSRERPFDQMPTPEQIESYMHENSDKLSTDPTAHVGGWRDDETGKTYLDVTHVLPDKQEALQLARQHDQLGIYDLAGQNTIYTNREVPPALQSKLKRMPELADTHEYLQRYLSPSEYGRLTPQGLEAVHNVLLDSQGGKIANAQDLAAMAGQGVVKRGWYEKSGKALAHLFGDDAPRFSALLAALSPQTSVEMNLTNALNVWKNWIAEGRPTDERHIMQIMGSSVLGNKGEQSVMGAWRNNSIAALTHPDPANLQLSGPKVNSFAANLRGVMNEVTNDSWMAQAMGVAQSLFSGASRKGEAAAGKGAGYLAVNALTGQAAELLTKHTGTAWSPAEVQETVWSFVKAAVEAHDNPLQRGDTMGETIKSLTPQDIAGTADFSTLLHDPKYANILREAGYGPQLDTLHGQGLTFDPAAAGDAAPYGARRIGKIAKRLEQQYQNKGTQDLVNRPKEVNPLALD